MHDGGELTDVEDDAWPGLLDEIGRSERQVEVLPGDTPEGQACLERLQVTAASRLGAMALHCGGLVIDHGWIRMLGGSPGRDGLPSLAEANELPPAPGTQGDLDASEHRTQKPDLLVGYDILGGVFLLNGSDPASNGRPGEPGSMLHLSPEDMDWSDTKLSYGRWLSFLLSPYSPQMYDRWPGWERESEALSLDDGLAIYPYPWSHEARVDPAAISRRPVPIAELLTQYRDFCPQLDKPDPGPLGTLA